MLEARLYRGKPTIYYQMWEKVRTTFDDECWQPLGYVEKNGYWKVNVGKNQWAHRVAFEMRYGSSPEEDTDHLCRNTWCWNPRHLESVTHQENGRRGNAGVVHSHCKRGHELTSENVNVARTTGARNCKRCSKIRMEKYLASVRRT